MTTRRSPLDAQHEAADARLTDFGGWEMPVSFDSITTEHEAVRTDVGRFDVSHMGQLEITGPDATTLIQRLVTNDVAALDIGEAVYAAVTTEDGIMLDDVLVYRRPAETGSSYLVIPNAGHDGSMADRFEAHADQWSLEATIANRTDEYGMLAVQGPSARETVADRLEIDVGSLDRFEGADYSANAGSVFVSRTGYTGEDGLELIVPRERTADVWESLDGVQCCGLGARDTLRLEAGFLLSGQDFHPDENPRTPYEAGIGFAVKLDTEFVGRDALEQDATEGPAERLVGIKLIDRGVPRSGYPITDPDGEQIGTVTSGTMSPTLSTPIALGYVPADHSEPGTRVRVEVRGEAKKAKIEPTPFVDTGQ